MLGTRVAETILASGHVRLHTKAGHMIASDPIKTLRSILRGGGRPHMGSEEWGSPIWIAFWSWCRGRHETL